ncbi:MAG: hypothetical protein ACLPKI_33315 [Streptosporangiaceae bacterium]
MDPALGINQAVRVTAVRNDGVVDTKMIKTAGEHWVCTTLARCNWAPALTRDGLERTDILAVNTQSAHRPTVEIQVKTASQRGETTSWPLGTKAQLFAKSEHEWFVLVLLPELPGSPSAFVVPRDHLSAATWIVHQDWRTAPSAPVGTRNAGLDQARIRWTVFRGYEDRWDLLGKRTTEVAVLLDPGLRELALDERVGLPPGHPWKDHLPKFCGPPGALT